MLLFRGQNTNTPIAVNSGRPETLGGRNGAVYFVDFATRSQAFAYALQNFNVLLDDDCEEDETFDKGFVFKCHYNEVKPTLLNNIPAFSSDEIIDCWASVHSKLPKETYPSLSTLFEDLENESVYDAIQLLEGLSKAGEIEYDTYLSCVKEITDCVGSSIASVVYEDGSLSASEYVVFNIDNVTVDSVHEVFRDQIRALDHTVNVKESIAVVKAQRGKVFDSLTI